LFTPFWMFLVATLIQSGYWLLVQATTGPAYVLLFLPAIPAMLIYTIIIQVLLSATHIGSARLLGYRVETAALGPVEVVRGGKFKPHLVQRLNDVGGCRIVAPESPIQQLLGHAFFGIDVAVLLILGLLSVVIREVMLALGIHPLIVDLTPNAFGHSIISVFGVFFVAFTIETIFDIVPGKKRRGFWASSLIYATSQRISDLGNSALRPRDWPSDLVSRQVRTSPFRSMKETTEGFMGAYYHWLDVGDVPKAGHFLDQAAAYLGPFRRFAHPSFYPELAYYLARHKSNPRAARVRLEQASKPDSRPQVVLRAEAALHLAEGRHQDALDAANRALLLTNEHSPAGIRELERDLLRDLMDEARRSLDGRPTIDTEAAADATHAQEKPGGD
jgi:hypothetical protein